MASVQYFVTRHKGQWMVALNCEYSGPYATEEEATASPSTPRQGTSLRFSFKGKPPI
jgi:hypothetical protein